MDPAQTWTAIGVLAATSLGSMTLIATLLNRTLIAQFAGVGVRLDGIDHRLDGMDRRLDGLDRDVQALSARVFRDDR